MALMLELALINRAIRKSAPRFGKPWYLLKISRTFVFRTSSLFKIQDSFLSLVTLSLSEAGPGRSVCLVTLSLSEAGPGRSVCLVTLSLSEAGPGRFGRQISVTDIYHTIPYHTIG